MSVHSWYFPQPTFNCHYNSRLGKFRLLYKFFFIYPTIESSDSDIKRKSNSENLTVMLVNILVIIIVKHCLVCEVPRKTTIIEVPLVL